MQNTNYIQMIGIAQNTFSICGPAFRNTGQKKQSKSSRDSHFTLVQM